MPRACGLDPDDAELHFRKAVLHRKAGQPAEAEACWRRILTLKRPDRFCSVDQGIYGHLTLRNLAVLAEERGDHDEALRLWKHGPRGMSGRCRGDGTGGGRAVNRGDCFLSGSSRHSITSSRASFGRTGF